MQAETSLYNGAISLPRGNPELRDEPGDAYHSQQQDRPKALAMLSGGLDSMLAVKLMVDQGVDVEVVNFATPFCLCDRCSVDRFAKDYALKVHRIFLGQEFLDIVADPPHGYGSQMNPCIDCRILMFKKAKELAGKLGADFIVTGEVLGERPFSQRKTAMLHIEKEAGLEGRIVRPLSAKLLPESEPERKRLVDRDGLLAIRGRRRLPQIELAANLGIKDYPCPAGGCLLTDPRFAARLKEHLIHKEKLTLTDVALLKIGRHFRLETVKLIVGRNERENKKLQAIARSRRMPWLEVVGYPGPVALLLGEVKPNTIARAAAITIRYSDSPRETPAKVIIQGKEELIMTTKAVEDQGLENFRV